MTQVNKDSRRYLPFGQKRLLDEREIFDLEMLSYDWRKTIIQYFKNPFFGCSKVNQTEGIALCVD